MYRESPNSRATRRTLASWFSLTLTNFFFANKRCARIPASLYYEFNVLWTSHISHYHILCKISFMSAKSLRINLSCSKQSSFASRQLSHLCIFMEYNLLLPSNITWTRKSYTIATVHVYSDHRISNNEKKNLCICYGARDCSARILNDCSLVPRTRQQRRLSFVINNQLFPHSQLFSIHDAFRRVFTSYFRVHVLLLCKRKCHSLQKSTQI